MWKNMYILIHNFARLNFDAFVGGKKLYNLHNLYPIFTFNI